MTREQALENALRELLRCSAIPETWAAPARVALALPPDNADALIRPKNGEAVYIHSMGKRLRLTAVATSDNAANRHSAKSDDAVVACFGSLVLMANRYDNGTA